MGSLYSNIYIPVKIINLNCIGHEDTIWDCSYSSAQGSQYCSFYNDASVACHSQFDCIILL